MNSWKNFPAIITLVLSSNANSAIINTLNGIEYEWLELTETAGFSRDQVEIRLTDSNDVLYGYEYASRSLVEDLFLSYAPWDGLNGTHTNSLAIDGVVSMLGDFGQLNYVNYGTQTTVSTVDGGTVSISEIDRSTAFYGNQSECGIDSCVALIMVYDYFGNPVSAYQTDAGGWDATASYVTTHPSDSLGSSKGSFLVRTSVVPVPAAIWLFGSGLVGLVGFAKLKKNIG